MYGLRGRVFEYVCLGEPLEVRATGENVTIAFQFAVVADGQDSGVDFRFTVWVLELRAIRLNSWCWVRAICDPANVALWL